MRQDLAHVMHDMARGGSHFRNRGTALRLDVRGLHSNSEELEDFDSGPVRAPMSISARGLHYANKSTGIRYATLTRFLEAKVGRLWNHVYSDIRRRFDVRAGRNQEVLNCVDGLVNTNCYVGEDGEVYVREGFYFWRRGFYVHPTTGILCRVEHQTEKKKIDWKKKAGIEKVLKSAGLSISLENVRLVDGLTILEKKYGFWFIHKLTPLTSKDMIEVRRVSVLGTVWTRVPYTPKSGRPSLRVVSCHQMNTKQLRRHRDVIAGNPF